MKMNILFDSWSSQVLFQQKPPHYPPGSKYPTPTGQRLNTILGAMKSFGLSTGEEWNVSFTHPPITQGQLTGVDVYVSLTRYLGTGFAYTSDELNLVKQFVSEGGAILLMTNHGRLSDQVPNWTENDSALAELFGIELQNYFVTSNDYMVMKVNADLPSPLNYIANQVAGISAHDSCIIQPPADFVSLICFPRGATAFDYATGKTIAPPFPYYSILVPYYNGNVIVVGNSGNVGDFGSPTPAPGLIPMENNLMFFLNCVGYLGGLTCIPKPGQGPC
jgi:hypothetical protein